MIRFIRAIFRSDTQAIISRRAQRLCNRNAEAARRYEETTYRLMRGK